MSARPWMPLWCGDFLADTEHLSCAESGAYILLLVHLWLTGKLPDDDKRLARIARATPRQWRSIRPVLEPFFDIGNNICWRHKRIDEEIAKARNFSEIQRDRANQRWGEGDANGIARARATSQSPSLKEDKNSEADASAVPAQPPAPVYTDSKHELWGEGVPILISLGLPEARARSMIGCWLKQTRDDAQAVLGAIQRARDQRIHNPIPWITRAIPSNQESNHARRDKPTNMESAARLAAHIEAGGSLDPTTWIDVPRPEGPPPVRSRAGNGVAQLLPPKRH